MAGSRTAGKTGKASSSLGGSSNPYVLSQILSVSPFRDFVGIPHILWGIPGIGKTTFVGQLAKSLGRECHTVIGSLLEPQDILGYPVPCGKVLKFLPPEFLASLSGNDVLFLDELTCTSPSVQHALLRLILERSVGDCKIPNETIIVSAANPPDISNGYELSLPLLNRFSHVIFPPMVESFVDFLLGYNDFNISERILNVLDDYDYFRKEVIHRTRKYKVVLASLLKKEPKYYFSKEIAADSYAFPTPRSWEFAIVSRSVCDVLELNNLSFEIVKCAVGESAAIAFLNEEKSNRIPDVVELLSGDAVLPGDIREDEVFVVSRLILTKICDCQDIQLAVRGLEIIFELSKGHPDVIFVPIYSCIKEGKLKSLAEKQEAREVIHKIGRNISAITQIFKTAS